MPNVLAPPAPPAHRALSVAFVVFLLAAVAAASLTWRMEEYRLQERRTLAANAASDHADALQRNVEQALSAAHALAALVRQGNGTISDFDAVGRQMLSHYPSVSGLSLAPAGIIQEVVPLAGNEKAINLDLLNNPATKNEASTTRDTGKITLTGPFKLVSGKLAAIGRLPIFLDDAKGNPSFWGFINVEIDFPEALEAARLLELATQGYAYELWRTHPESSTRQIIAASSSTALIDPVEQALQVPNATWTLSVMPVNGWGDPLGLSLKGALGVLFSLLLAFVAKLVVELRAHQQGLETLVAQRTVELETANRALRESEARFRSLTDLSSDWYWEQDRELRLSFHSSGFALRSGTTSEKLIGKRRWEEPNRFPLRGAWDEHRATLQAHEPFRDFEYVRIGDDGKQYFVSLSGVPIYDAEGEFNGYRGVGKNITERKLAEQALARESHRNEVFLRNSSDGVHILDADGNVLEVSDSFCEMLGYSREELIGANVSLWDAHWSPQELKQVIAEQLAKKGRSVFETQHRRRDGSIFGVEVTGQPLELDGKPVVFNSARDIAERIRAQDELRFLNEQLEQRVAERTNALRVANRELEAFSYSVSHDLRAPLRAIDGFSNILQEQCAGQVDEQSKDLFRRLSAAAEKMGRLIDDLLKLSRISLQEMKRGSVDLSGLAREVVEELKAEAPGRKAEWVIAPQVVAHGDPGLLTVLLQNLIGNAWKYSSRRDAVRIEFGVTEKDGRPAYFVRDNGAGFDMVYADKLFRAFQRLHSPAEFPGTGIGLATVARIVHRHGGDVWAEGHVGEGASFYFTV